MLTTRLTERFGLRYPILSAPMAGHSDGRLAAAVTNAGGLGMFGASGMSPDQVRHEIAAARSLTAGPFGVGFITQRLPAEEAQFVAALETGVTAIVFSFDDPATWVARTRQAGLAAL